MPFTGPSLSLYEDYARKRGLQGKSLLILLWIYRHPKGISQQTITRHTYSTKQVVNAVIKNFSKKGYIKSTVHPKDRRKKLIMLTEKGRQFAASIIDPMDEAEKKAFSQLSAKQQQTLIETTHLFTDVLTQEFMLSYKRKSVRIYNVFHKIRTFRCFSTTGEYMIELKQIRKDYGERTVIKNQSLSIKDKEFFVLIGPSGSGKTTLLKLINRLIDPTEGDVLLDGKSVMDYPLRELRLNTGYVLQQIALFPNLTVAENIELVPVMKKWPKQIRKEQTTQLLSKVGLDPKIYAHCYPHELSGGEQQRVGIVRAIIGKPEILLMDEPFSALDPISRRQLQDLIKHSTTN